MIRINEQAFKRILKKGSLILCTGVLALCLSGCDEQETVKNVTEYASYDMIDTTDSKLLENGIQQILDVPGENFKLVVNYRCLLNEGEHWTVTADKEVYMDVCTDGLHPDYKVYIDNVHTDTIIKSHYPVFDGITQDTMDDRIHNSHMTGFPISDTNTYSNINVIEGQNDTFINGSFLGFSGLQSGSITQRRYVERDYLSAGVYANKINSVIDLIVEKPDGTTRCVSIPSTVGISVWPYAIYKDSLFSSDNGMRYYYFDEVSKEMKNKTISEAEYAQIEEQYKTKKLSY